MSNRRWINNTQPQTLQMAVILLYLNAAFMVVFGLVGKDFPLGLALVVGQAGGAYGTANERKWGYGLAIVMAVLPLVFILTVGGVVFGGTLLGIMLQVALVALLVHPQSREYQRIWFK
ncbi:MAG TPA: hypothetical protein VFW24_12105 [Acidimicrobiales bacterium]|nr:hypothetical protein [Acidimicrobiales bacterium]